MNIVQENINNLTSLWRSTGQQAGGYEAGVLFDVSAVEYSGWPNKLWFHCDLDEPGAQQARDRALGSEVRLSVPYWDIYSSESYRWLEAQGFEPQSEQRGMSLPLADSYEADDALYLKPVTDEAAARRWEDLFEQAFGYTISYRLLLLPDELTHYWTAYQADHEPVGTAVTHATGAILGIHSMGVVPSQRRKGWAEQMMRVILNQAITQEYHYATLQASAMGKGLYQKLGFQEQFVMKNYALPQPT